MRRKTRLAPTAKVTEEIVETAMPRRLLSCRRGEEAAMFDALTESGNERFWDGYALKTHI